MSEIQVTLRQLREWQACSDGRSWFESKFPQGGTYGAVQQALRADSRFGDSRWLTDAVFRSLLVDPAGVTAAATEDAKAEIATLIKGTDPEAVKTSAPADVAAGDEADAGDSARIGSSGYSARIGSSGDSAQIGSSGNSAQIGSSGDSAQIGSSGYSARIGSSGDSARIAATGQNATVCSAAPGAKARAAAGGVLALAWFDTAAQRPRVAVGYVGEGLQADTWYTLDEAGNFVETEAEA